MEVLVKTQQFVLSALRELIPPTVGLDGLHIIYEQSMEAFTQGESPTNINLNQQIELTHQLVVYFVELVRENLVSSELYQALEAQTQKAQATIRSHIKAEQEMKMYLEYLQSKVDSMGKLLVEEGETKVQGLKKQLSIVQVREDGLQKQKINLIKKLQKLSTQLDILTSSSNKQSAIKLQNLDESPSLQEETCHNNGINEKYCSQNHQMPTFKKIPESRSHIPSFLSNRSIPESEKQQKTQQNKSSRRHNPSPIITHSNLNLNVNLSIKPQIFLRKLKAETQQTQRQGKKCKSENKSNHKYYSNAYESTHKKVANMLIEKDVDSDLFSTAARIDYQLTNNKKKILSGVAKS